MHELALTQSIVDAITEQTADAGVAAVRLTIGRLSGVVPEAVRFSFDVVAAGTTLDGARLVIDQPRGRARCRACGAAFEVADLVLLCPCGSADVEVVSGRELKITSVEVR